MTRQKDQYRLNQLRLKAVINIVYPATAEELASTVERQDVQQGKTLYRGKSVSILVYGPYEEPVSIPELKGKTTPSNG